MPNKFQKSVMERLEQEAAIQRRKSQESKKEIPAAKSGPEKEPQPEKAPAGLSPAEKPRRPDEISQPDVSEYIRKEQPRSAKNKTFYLDSDVVEAVKKAAKSQKVTDSKLVNDILRRVLGLR